MVKSHNSMNDKKERGDVSMRKVIANRTQAAGRAVEIPTLMLGIALVLGLMFVSQMSVPTAALASGVVNSCSNCHGYPPTDSATRDGTTGQFPGTHNTHTGTWYTTTDSRYGFNCEICHANPIYTTFGHQNDNVQVNLRWISFAGNIVQNGSVSGWGSYSRGTSFALSNQTTVNQVCTNTYCHSNGTGGAVNGIQVRPIEPNISPMWGTNTPGGPGCTPCHGHETGNPGNGAPWYTSGWKMATQNWGSFKANSHQAHAPSGAVCNKCHYTTTNTGNTITSVGNHIKMNYSVSAGTGISYTYTFTSTGGTCTTISCHGGGSMKWGTGAADCVSCHGGSFGKTLGGTSGWHTIRKVVGNDATADFNMSTIGNGTGSRHLYGASTVVKWDCIVCHRAGWATGGSIGKPNVSYHNNNTGITTTSGWIYLRNVDTTDESSGWAIDNVRWTTSDYASLDQFCVTCHDADGASQVQVNATNSGLIFGANTRSLTPFNSTDTAAGYVAGSTYSANAGQRTRVINIKDKFYPGTVQPLTGANGSTYNGNPSQHAVLGMRYGTTSSWATAAWVNYTLKKTGQSLQAVRETAILSCADCHVLDSGSGAHGGNTLYNMWGSSGASVVCVRCHAAAAYKAACSTAARMRHNADTGNIGTRTGYGLPTDASYNCYLCHGSWNQTDTVSRNASYGGIHGSWSSVAAYPALTTTTAYRFQPGTWRRSSNADFTSATTSTCYFAAGTTDNFSSCTSHAGANTTTTLNYLRPVKY